MLFYGRLMEKCHVKLVDYVTVDNTDLERGVRGKRIICYIETENAWCDSGDSPCLSRDMAREEAARRFLGLLKMHNFDDKKINNLDTRSMSPASTESRSRTDKGIRSTLSYSPPRAGRSSSVTPPPDTRLRRASVFGSIKSVFGVKKISKSPR